MEIKRPTLGRGKHMSIPKAALKYYFEELVPEQGNEAFIDHGMRHAIHRIVDIAGARHCSFLTAPQVTARLAKSNLWEKTFHPTFYRGIGNGGANLFTPSEKGRKYYAEHIRTNQK